MSSILLIEEMLPSQSNIIVESATEGKNCYLNGIFMQGGIRNRNKRIYSVTEISKAVESAQATIKETNGIFGELDHPQSLNINLDRISHVITDLRMEGNNAIGRARLLDTPMGRIARTLADSGVRIGVSSRGAGSINEEGEVSGFTLITVDLVATPSAPDAMPLSVYESLDRSRNGNQILSLSEAVKEDPAAQKYFVQEMKKFIEQSFIYTKK